METSGEISPGGTGYECIAHALLSRECIRFKVYGCDTLVPSVFVPLDQRSGLVKSACAVRDEDSRYEIAVVKYTGACIHEEWTMLTTPSIPTRQKYRSKRSS